MHKEVPANVSTEAQVAQAISDQTKLQLPLSVAVTALIGVVGGAAWLTTLQIGQASLLSTVQTMQVEHKEDKKEFTDALKVLQTTTVQTQLDVVEMKGDVKALRRR